MAVTTHRTGQPGVVLFRSPALDFTVTRSGSSWALTAVRDRRYPNRTVVLPDYVWLPLPTASAVGILIQQWLRGG